MENKPGSEEMHKHYQPVEIQERWYAEWEQRGYFAPAGDGDPYCIVIPPPNVTGTLHMGHGFQCTLMDALIRYQRMRGQQVLWQAGSDHAGISTQLVVERQLELAGSSRTELGREAFERKVWDWKEESGGHITRQLRRLGASLDWESERFTMDEGMSAAVLEAFVRLYQQGLIYRGQRLVNWEPVLKTAVSDLEVVNEEAQGVMYHIRYLFVDDAGEVIAGDGGMTIATTRPETMLVDGALAVAPGDPRYQDFVGRRVRVPRTQRNIEIIEDEYVDPEFGSGCVKITAAHDFNDFEVAQRHPDKDIPCIILFDETAHLNDNAPPEYRGLDRYEARRKIVEDLRAEGLLLREDPHSYVLPKSERTGVVVEPMLTSQWFVKVKPLAERAIKAVEDGEVQFVPRNWENTYFAWMREIRDWCISRQLWWGHRIPAWYDESGAFYVGRSEQEVREQHGLGQEVSLRQDEDVLDTWFSSGLWSFATLGWPEDTQRLRTFLPTSVLVTGFDIIFFWVARMMMLTLHFTNQVPFRQVYIHGLIRDEDGQKMSKSKGNVLDPIDLIDGIDTESLVQKRTGGLLRPEDADKIAAQTRKRFPQGIDAYGVDAVRFTYCSLASTGRDINFDLSRLEGYRNFCNKLWNAARYVQMSTSEIELKGEMADASVAEQWIESRLHRVCDQVDDAMDNYRFDLAAQTLYSFVWNDYCDWLLEIAKTVLAGDDIAARRRMADTLLRILEAVLRLAHPIIPFLTEEIWHKIAPRLDDAHGESIMLARYPRSEDFSLHPQSEETLEWLQEVVGVLRNIRAEVGVPHGKPVSVLLSSPDAPDAKVVRERVDNAHGMICQLANVETINWLEKGASEPVAAVQIVRDLRIAVPLQDLVEPQAELARLDKSIAKAEKELSGVRARLDNSGFREKAPAQLVESLQQRSGELEDKIAGLHQHYQNVKSLLGDSENV